MTLTFIGLGSNLGGPAERVRAAIAALAALPESELRAVSAFYRSRAIGPGEQPDYCNAVAALATRLTPDALLDALLAIERREGRVRDGRRWLARRLDLDLLCHGRTRCATDRLRLPHPRIRERVFVLRPWCDIAPQARVPGQGRVQALCAALDGADIGLWRSSALASDTPVS